MPGGRGWVRASPGRAGCMFGMRSGGARRRLGSQAGRGSRRAWETGPWSRALRSAMRASGRTLGGSALPAIAPAADAPDAPWWWGQWGRGGRAGLAGGAGGGTRRRAAGNCAGSRCVAGRTSKGAGTSDGSGRIRLRNLTCNERYPGGMTIALAFQWVGGSRVRCPRHDRWVDRHVTGSAKRIRPPHPIVT